MSEQTNALSLARSALEEREQRIRELEEALQNLADAMDNAYISTWQSTAAWQKQLDAARSVLNKETK